MNLPVAVDEDVLRAASGLKIEVSVNFCVFLFSMWERLVMWGDL